MKMRMLLPFLLAVGLVAPAAHAGDDPVVAHLALFLDAFGHQSGLPQDADAEAIRPHLSAALNRSIDTARTYQAQYIADHPDEKPPWIEGPLFNGSGSEPYTAYEIIAPFNGCEATRCLLRVEYTDTSVTPEIHWHDDYAMVLEDGQWRLDDVEYEAGFEFGNHGNLRANLAVEDQED